MAYWDSVRTIQKNTQNAFGGGENVGVPAFEIADNETSYSRNMDSREYPAASVRPGRSTYATVFSTTNINGIGQRKNTDLHVEDGNTWKYWNPTTTSYTNLTTALTATASAELEDFATGTNRYTILMNSTQKLIWDGTSTALALGTSNTPLSSIFAVHKGRIYIARDNDIKYCALNKTTDWTTANDAGSIDITQAKGVIIGMCEYADHVIAFTEHSMHELYGTGPLNYKLVDIEGEVGCISNRSITKVNNRLYWMWYDGIYQYGGGTPVKVSDAVQDYIKGINFTYKTKIAGGSIGDFLYMAIPYGATSNNLILKYDTRLNKWYVETGSIIDFVTIGNTLYGVDSAGITWNMRNESSTDDAGTPIPWELISKPFTEQSLEGKKTVSDMYLLADVSTGSTAFSVGYSTNTTNNDSTTFTALTTISGSSNTQNTRIQVPYNQLQNTNWYRLRIAGTGQATIHYLQKNIRIKRR